PRAPPAGGGTARDGAGSGSAGRGSTFSSVARVRTTWRVPFRRWSARVNTPPVPARRPCVGARPDSGCWRGGPVASAEGVAAPVDVRAEDGVRAVAAEGAAADRQRGGRAGIVDAAALGNHANSRGT